MPNPLLSPDGMPIGDAGNGFPSGMTGVYSGNRIAGAYLRGNKHFEVQSGAIIAPPPPPPPDHEPDPTHSPDPDHPVRMTGGGNLITVDGKRVTHGFVLPCTVGGKRKDALQIHWRDDHRFQLENLTAAACSAEGGTMFHRGNGTGRYNDTAGASVEWTFTDAGSPGTGDTARIVVRNSAGTVVLDVSGSLRKGEHRTHWARD
jgi:hypothetical protein